MGKQEYASLKSIREKYATKANFEVSKYRIEKVQNKSE